MWDRTVPSFHSHLSIATLQSRLHVQLPLSAVFTFHWLRNVCNIAILFKLLQTPLINEVELHKVLSSCSGDRAGTFPLEVTFKWTKVHLFLISTAQLKHFILSWALVWEEVRVTLGKPWKWNLVSLNSIRAVLIGLRYLHCEILHLN